MSDTGAQIKQPAEAPRYTAAYLIECSRSLLGSRRALVAGALSRKPQDDYSVTEALTLVRTHTRTPVVEEIEES